MADNTGFGQDYQRQREQVLQLWRGYLSDHGGSVADGLEKRGRRAEESKFHLIVAGEVKAGKSTLINALLGEMVLPSDVLQCSSAIVEIGHSDTVCLEIEFADGHCESHSGLDKLAALSSVDERMRELPTDLIDGWIRTGQLDPLNPPPLSELVAKLEKHSRLPLHGKEDLIADYIRNRRKKDIVVVVRLGYPLRYAFDGLRIVDTPGVNAVGGIEDSTFAYLEQSDAILFVHSIEAPPESASFGRFVRECPKHVQGNLFLVLTKSANVVTLVKRTKLAEAARLFSDFHRKQRVLAVDSLQKLIAGDLEQQQSSADVQSRYQQLRDQAKQRSHDGEKSARADEVLYETMDGLLWDAERESKASDWQQLRQFLLQQSQFPRLEALLEHFALQAPLLQLAELLSSVGEGYRALRKTTEDNLHLKTTKVEDPAGLIAEVGQRIQAINEYRQQVEQLSFSVPATKNQLTTQLSSLEEDYLRRADRVGGEGEARACLSDFSHQLGQQCRQTAQQFVRDLESRLNKIGSALQQRYRFDPPWVDADSIITVDKDDFYTTRTISRRSGSAKRGGFWGAVGGGFLGLVLGGPVGVIVGAASGAAAGGAAGYASGSEETIREFDSSSYLRALRRQLLPAIKETIAATPGKIIPFLESCQQDFKRTVDELMATRTRELEDICQRQQDNEKLRQEIEQERQRLQKFDRRLHKIAQQQQQLDSIRVAVGSET